jgi:CBS domain-containing protein
MRCEKLMSKNVVCIDEDDTVQKAAVLMRDLNIGFLPVCDLTGRVVGTVTDRDIAIRLCAEDGPAAATPVGTLMSRELVACAQEDDVRVAESLMASYRKSRVLVLDPLGLPVGVISLSDIVWRDSNRHTARTLRKIVTRELGSDRVTARGDG